MEELKVVMSYADLLSWTACDVPDATRVELLRLPKDPQLNDRLALVACGPHAERVMAFLTHVMEQVQAAPVAAQPPGSQSHGPEPRI